MRKHNLFYNIFELIMLKYNPSKDCMNFDSSTGCERGMFGHFQHNNRVGDA